MSLKKVRLVPRVSAACASLLLFFASCTPDFFGPVGPFDQSGALHSLALGIGRTGASLIFGPFITTLGSVAPQLDSVDVIVNGTVQKMFALGIRETYPPGTCTEDLQATGTPPGTCTPLAYSTALILWQAHSAGAPPDKLALIIGNTGANDFQDQGTVGVVTPIAIYFELGTDIWDSLSGTLTSNVASTTETCTVPIPPYARTGTCASATFDEEGTINFVPETGLSPRTLVIPRQTLRGIWQTNTEIQPTIVNP